MIYKRFYKREARADNYDQSHCYDSCDLKAKKHKYYPIAHKICDYFGSNKLAPDAVQYWGNIVQTGKVWYI